MKFYIGFLKNDSGIGPPACILLSSAQAPSLKSVFCSKFGIAQSCSGPSVCLFIFKNHLSHLGSSILPSFTLGVVMERVRRHSPQITVWLCKLSNYSVAGSLILKMEGKKEKMCTYPVPRLSSIWCANLILNLQNIYCVVSKLLNLSNEEITSYHMILGFNQKVLIKF